MVYRRRDKFRYVTKKDVHGKNNVLRDLSACVIQQFNGYEISWQKLKGKQKCFLEPIDIVYELDKENENIRCYFASDLVLTYRTYYSQKVRGKEVISNLSARQYYYCDHFFISKDILEKHVKTCSNIARITYKVSNRKLSPFKTILSTCETHPLQFTLILKQLLKTV